MNDFDARLYKLIVDSQLNKVIIPKIAIRVQINHHQPSKKQRKY